MRHAWIALAVAGLAALSCSKKESIIGGAVVIDTTAAWIPLDASKPADTVRFASLNMSIGFPVSQLLFVDMANDTIAYNVLDSLYKRYQRGRPSDRIRAMARAIDSLDLDVVGLQEVMSFNRDGVKVNDFLAELAAGIVALGGPAYQILPCPLNDTLLVGAKGGKTITISFHEGNAMLVRPGFQILDSATFQYFSLLPIPTAAGTVTERALQYVKFKTPKGVTWQAFNTHLEVFEDYSSSQTLELRKIADSLKVRNAQGLEAAPRVVIGDFNVNPGEYGHRILFEAGFRDTFDTTATDPGHTCCIASSALWDTASAFSGRRIDFIMARHAVNAFDHKVELKGAVGDSVRILASDHRMVRVSIVGQ